MPNLTMYGIREPSPGPRWRALFDATWPAYRRWYLSEGFDARPTLTEAASALAEHMPELLPVWAKLSQQIDYDDLATTMLTQWRLPAFAPAACSQAVVLDPEPTLVRNYDYHPDLFECVSLSTDYLQPVIGTSDCLWGLLDGMNAQGLTVSLTFGGERRTGPGFAIPLVVRYVLEVCQDTESARQVLARLPVAMSYNLTVVDRSGSYLTAHLRPGRAAEFQVRPIATNHRWDNPLDHDHATRYRSVERQDHLRRLVQRGSGSERIAAEMLRAPLHSREYGAGFGTLYTAVYRATSGRLDYHWPGQRWSRTFDSPEDTIAITLNEDYPYRAAG